MAKSFGTAIGVAELATPTANPPAGVQWLYPKADGQWYTKDSSGAESAIAGVGGGGGSSAPVGTILEYAGLTAPSGYGFCDGTAVSRTTYSTLFDAMSAAITGTTTSGSTNITAVSSTANLAVGMPLSGPGIPANATITVIGTGTLTISPAATASGTGVAIRVCPHGVGDGSTTFNLPDHRVRQTVGVGTGKRLGGNDAVAEASRQNNFSHSHGHGSSGSATSAGTGVTASAATGGSHSHTTTVSTFSHNSQSNTTATGTATRLNSPTDHSHTVSNSTDPGHGHTVSVSDPGHSHSISTSVGTNGTNDHPFSAVNKIIKLN